MTFETRVTDLAEQHGADWGRLGLEAYLASKAITATDVCIYDTRLDSDGGAWRFSTQDTSWYNEPLNTATRGSRREFPQVAVIVAEVDKVTIYDGDSPALNMWMVFVALGGLSANGNLLAENADINSMDCINGRVIWSQSHEAGRGGVRDVNFLSDTAFLYRSDTIYGRYKGNISQRNSGLSYGDVFGNHPIIIANGTNSVAITVLPDAPIDHATGLPVPTIAVGTDGGVSIIKHDGTVVDWTKANGPYVQFVGFRRTDNALCAVFDNFASVSKYRHVLHKIPASDLNEAALYYQKGSSDEYYPMYFNAVYVGTSIPLSSNVVSSKGWTGLEDAGSDGLYLLKPNPAEPAKGMLCRIAHDHNTGWMRDIRGAWLSDTTEGNLVGSTALTDDFTSYADSAALQLAWTAAANTVVELLSGAIKVENASTTNAYASKSFSTAIGATYTVRATLVSVNISTPRISVGTSAGSSSYAQYQFTSTPGAIEFTIVATATTSHINLLTNNTTLGAYVVFDDISVKLATPDRSFNNKALIVNGTLTRTPVNTGCDLVAYGGFSETNYLEQPYNPDLDFGTGDFSITGWYKAIAVQTTCNLITLKSGLSEGIVVTKLTSTSPNNQKIRASLNANNYTSSISVNVDKWIHVCVTRENGVLTIYQDAQVGYTGASVENISLGNNDLVVGWDPFFVTTQSSIPGMALWRISATAPSANQVKQMYEDEKRMFEPGAQSTLYGTSDIITALAHDADTDELHVGTSSGRSTFKGLVRVANTTTPVTTAIAAGNGMVVSQ
jgi:hypothetical protein